MTQMLRSAAFILFFAGCYTKSPENEKQEKNSMLELIPGKLNEATMADTLFVSASSCRGCAPEYTPQYELTDSMSVVSLHSVEVVDNNPPDMDGGSLENRIVMLPLKTGSTIIKLYSFMTGDSARQDSSQYTAYQIRIQKNEPETVPQQE